MIGLPGQDIFVPLEVNAPFVEREVMEIIADSLSKAGWSRRCVAAFESPRGRSRWIADRHQQCADYGANP
jgi:hypothetical protein